MAAIEIAVTAGEGGAGSVWIDDLTLEPLPPPDATPPPPRASASSASPEHAAAALDGDAATGVGSRAVGDSTPGSCWIFGEEREFGGLVLDWVPGRQARDYVVEASGRRRRWRELTPVLDGGTAGATTSSCPRARPGAIRLRALAPGGRRGR